MGRRERRAELGSGGGGIVERFAEARREPRNTAGDLTTTMNATGTMRTEIARTLGQRGYSVTSHAKAGIASVSQGGKKVLNRFAKEIDTQLPVDGNDGEVIDLKAVVSNTTKGLLSGIRDLWQSGITQGKKLLHHIDDQGGKLLEALLTRESVVPGNTPSQNIITHSVGKLKSAIQQSDDRLANKLDTVMSLFQGKFQRKPGMTLTEAQIASGVEPIDDRCMGRNRDRSPLSPTSYSIFSPEDIIANGVVVIISEKDSNNNPERIYIEYRGGKSSYPQGSKVYDAKLAERRQKQEHFNASQHLFMQSGDSSIASSPIVKKVA